MKKSVNMNIDENSALRDMLWAVPKSYEDFVDSTVECMEKDEGLKKVIMRLLQTAPESDSSDVLKVLCNYYGFNKPLELIDDDEEEMLVGASSGTGGIARASY